MIFSNMHAWEGDPAVMQVLVFATHEAKNEFEAKLPKQPLLGGKYHDENGIGAIYKLRAIRNASGKWSPCVRCGVSARSTAIIYMDHKRYKTPEEALQEAAQQLLAHIGADIREFQFAMIEVPVISIGVMG